MGGRRWEGECRGLCLGLEMCLRVVGSEKDGGGELVVRGRRSDNAFEALGIEMGSSAEVQVIAMSGKARRRVDYVLESDHRTLGVFRSVVVGMDLDLVEEMESESCGRKDQELVLQRVHHVRQAWWVDDKEIERRVHSLGCRGRSSESSDLEGVGNDF